MHNFDRGLIKWLPFDALSGYKEAIYVLKERKSEINKPLLSVDQIEQLNYELSTAINLKKNITVYYYSAGKVYYYSGVITELDYNNKRIKLNNNWLISENILLININ